MRSSFTLAFGLAAGLLATSAQAADFFGPAYGSGPVDPIYSSALFNFEGLYLGGTAGVGSFSSTTLGTVGVVIGSNFAINDALLAGGEVQADLYFDGGGVQGFGALALAKFGGYVSDTALLYGTAGGGWIDSSAVYAFGGGAEFAATNQVSLRGEVLGIGSWGASPSGIKGTAGLLWHIQ